MRAQGDGEVSLGRQAQKRNPILDPRLVWTTKPVVNTSRATLGFVGQGISIFKDIKEEKKRVTESREKVLFSVNETTPATDPGLV